MKEYSGVIIRKRINHCCTFRHFRPGSNVGAVGAEQWEVEKNFNLPIQQIRLRAGGIVNQNHTTTECKNIDKKTNLHTKTLVKTWLRQF